MSDGTTCVHVRITGQVQGVWFRGWTHDHATRLGLDGWVRNRTDGSVEAVFFGPAHKVDDMMDLCRRGPPAALVSDVDVTPQNDPPPPGFYHKTTG